MNRHWNEKEIDYLEYSWGTKSIEAIAKNLNRTIIAVKEKSVRLKLGDSRYCSEYVTLNQFCKALGIRSDAIKRVWIREKFKVLKHRKGRFIYRKVDVKYFWKWAEQHKNLLNFARMEENILGKEPSWVKEKRKADTLDPTKSNLRVWTEAEDNLLTFKLKSFKYTIKDLAADFNRTESAIRKRLYTLKLPYRPIPLDSHIRWSEGEKQEVRKLRELGYSNASIAIVINKSQHSIESRI